MTDATGGPETLSGELLLALRSEKGLTQLEVVSRARDAGFSLSQAQLSRIEKGRSRPTPEQTRALVSVYGLSRSRADHLVAQAEALAVQHIDARVVLQAGHAHNFQLRTREAEQRARLIRSYQPVMILGVLQTRAFAEAVFTPDDDLSRDDAEASVAARLSRWDALADPRRQWRLIQTEQALRWPVRSYRLQAEQVAQMRAAAELPNVQLRIIPLDTVAPTPAPLTGFHIYDDREVVVGTDLGTALVSAPERVSQFAARFSALESLAASVEESRGILARVENDYRARS